MPLTDEQQKQQIQSWMQDKNVSETCSACRIQQTNWIIGEIIVAPTYSDGPVGNIRIGGPSVPMIQVVCGNCGFVMLFAASAIGIVEK